MGVNRCAAVAAVTIAVASLSPSPGSAFRYGGAASSIISGRRGFVRQRNEHYVSFPITMKAPTRSLHAMSSNAQAGSPKMTRRRHPPNKREGLKWVIESIETCLVEERMKREPPPYASNSQKTGDEQLLLNALWGLWWARNPKEVAEAGVKIEALFEENEVSFAIKERVMKATATTGLQSTSKKLCLDMLGSNHIPSGMSYVALMNSLRKSGKLEEMERLLIDLSNAYRSNNGNCQAGVDIVAYNTYIGALCDAALGSYKSSRPRRLATSKGSDGNGDDVKLFNDYLAESVALLESGAGRERFFVAREPDATSYNTVLSCAAKLKSRRIVEKVLGLMNDNAVEADIYTYNARLRLSMADGNKSDFQNSEALSLIDEVMSHPNLKPDMYTIDLALVPLIREGRIGEILQLLDDFESTECKRNRKRYIGALGSFLVSLVRGKEIEFARTLFDSYVLPLIPEKPVDPAEYIPVLDGESVPLGKIKTAKSKKLQAFVPHFNTLIEGYRKLTLTWNGDRLNDTAETDEKKSFGCYAEARDLFDLMVCRGVCPDAYTFTSMLGVHADADGITELWLNAFQEYNIRMTPVTYQALVTAYGKVGDPSSAICAFDHMLTTLQEGRVNARSWNVLLGALSKGSRRDNSLSLDVTSSKAALMLAVMDRKRQPESIGQRRSLLREINSMTCSEAARTILHAMKSSQYLPRPDSQSYCLVASAMSHGEPCPDDAIALFREAMDSSVPADGRFLNACLRCYGDRVDSAVLVWKNEIRAAALAYEDRERLFSGTFPENKRKNLAAAYNALVYNCGRAGRPDIALKLAYAMNKEHEEPNETTYNSYLKGKEARGDAAKAIRLSGPYESLLEVECFKYDPNDQRRSNERRIRIIV